MKKNVKSPHILLVGGGSGGHVTPVLAVLEAVQVESPKIQVSWIAPRGDSFVSQFVDKNVNLHYIFAGKLRRYKGWEWWRYFKNFHVIFKNILDLFLVIIGFIQAVFIVVRSRPDICFNKGGFVGLPVGLACTLLRVPFVLHDSDTVPGIANQLIAPFATYITTGFPSTGFHKQKDRVSHVGIPIRARFFQALKKSSLRVNTKAKPLLFITGGSLGAQRLNNIITETREELSRTFDIVHVVGAENLENFQSKSGYTVLPFVTDDYAAYLKEAAIVIVRGGSTSIAEIAVAGSACVVVPNSFLYDQVENSRLLEKSKAAIVVDEIEAANSPDVFISAVTGLYTDLPRQKQLHNSLTKIFPRDASYRIAQLLLPYLV